MYGAQPGVDRARGRALEAEAAMSCSSLKLQLGMEHSVDKQLPGLSLRLRGQVMVLEDCSRICGSNNGRCIVLKGG